MNHNKVVIKSFKSAITKFKLVNNFLGNYVFAKISYNWLCIAIKMKMNHLHPIKGLQKSLEIMNLLR